MCGPGSEATSPSRARGAPLLESWLRELAPLGRQGDRAAVAARVVELERGVRASLYDLARAGFAPGRGGELCGALSDWRDAVLSMILRRVAPLPPRFAVVAVGGWGRRQLAPFSDLDILMLYRGGPDAAVRTCISDILYHLWDSGYDVASSACALRDVSGDAARDLHLLTSLLDSRFLGGDADLFAAMAAVATRVLRRSHRRFIAERKGDVDAMVERAGGKALVKEPDVKTGSGGLRSAQLIRWIAHALPGTHGASELERLLSPAALKRLRRSEDFLLFIRMLLHLSAGRREDTLHLEHQAAIAASLGIAGTDGRRMIRLMRHYYERTSDVVLCLLEGMDRIGRPRRLLGGSLRPGGPWCLSDRERLAVRPGTAPDALRAVEAATECSRRSLGVSSTLVNYLRASAWEIHRAPSRELFLRFRGLLDEPRSHLGLAALKLSDFLYAYLRPLRAVRHRIVYNPFHRSTVDQHSVDAVRELETFAERSGAEPERFLLPAQVAAGFADSIWVAKLALLLHDTGKAYGGDHAKNGAEIVRDFMRDFPTDSLFRDMLVFLTENHLLLPAIARRRVAGEAGVAGNLASELSLLAYPLEALELLYLVTCADVAATSPRAYTAWVASSLAGLFVDTREALTKGLALSRAAAAAGPVERAVGELESMGAPPEAAQLARELGARYCASTTARDIAADAAGLAGLEADGFRLDVSIFNDHLRIKVVARDRPGLFSLLAGILLANGADIVRATIHTHRDVAIDEFVVTDVHGNDILETKMEKELAAWVQDLRASLRRYWSDADALDRLVDDIERRMKPVHRAFRRAAEVEVKGLGENRLLVEISCTDRPALLYDVAHRMAALGLDLRAAAVDTTGWYVHDVFEVWAAEALDDAARELLRREIAGATEVRSPRPLRPESVS